ncbi:unnamed protein product [Symbiodinium sp. CCMP2456]|nr:unnamed protein product [Symbiodinium sp. CCMP2456]
MRPFAEQTGFSGSDHEWQEEFALLCRDRGSAKGIKLEEFVQLVNDSSDEGCYCSDSELRALLQQQQQQPPPSTTPAKAAPVAAKAAAAGVAPSRAPAKDPRRDLIEAVFSSLDKTSKGHLTAADMRPFAEQTGFSGSDHEWQAEFALLCRDRGSAKGIKLEEFVQLVNDSSDEGQAESHKLISSSILKLDPRRDLIEAVFSSLDKTRKGYLTAADMRPFAEQTGFSGSDHEWQEEFALLCRDRGSAKGIKLEEFVQLVNDSSDEGRCSWRGTIPRSSQDLIDAVFNALDRTGRGFLTAADMRPFAEQTGFTGTDEEWRLEFEALCQESRSSQGLGLDAFAKLVNDDSEDGCYCTDSELQALLQRLHQGSVDIKPSVSNAATSAKGSQRQPPSEVGTCVLQNREYCG